MDIRTIKSTARWYPLIDIPEQIALVKDDYRFKTVPAGRRSGKSERFKRYLTKAAMANPNGIYFVACPTRDQAKKIYWDDLKLMTFSHQHEKAPSETNLIIYMPNSSEIHLIGLDKPARIEGIPWTGGGIDEIADVKSDAWQAHILPALNTVNPLIPDYRAWCWLLGVPDGLNHYYDMCQYAINSGDPEWCNYSWKSADILPKDVIDSAKRQMSPKQFRQEFEASFETVSGRIYEDYSTENHTSRTIQPEDRLVWMHDQNYTPLSSAIGIIEGENIFLMDEIILTSAVSKQSAMEFVDKYEDHLNKHVIIYGDPSGKNGEKHGHPSDYIDIETVLRAAGWTYTRKVAKAHPAIKDRQNSVRAKIMTADGHRSLFVNPNTAPWCDKGLSTVQLKKGSTFQENQADNQYQHITTAIGYMVEVEFSIGKKRISYKDAA